MSLVEEPINERIEEETLVNTTCRISDVETFLTQLWKV